MTEFIEEQLKAMGSVQVIVVLKSAAGLAAATAPGTSPEEVARELEGYFIVSERSQFSALARAVPRKATRRGSRAAVGVALPVAPSPPKMRVYKNLGLALGVVDKEGLSALQTHASIQTVIAAPEFSLIRPSSSESTKLGGRITWGLKRLGVPKLWKKGLTGKGVLVGHLDTGVDGKHPALKGSISHFAEFDWMGVEIPR